MLNTYAYTYHIPITPHTTGISHEHDARRTVSNMKFFDKLLLRILLYVVYLQFYIMWFI